MTCPAADNPNCQHKRATDYGNYGCRCDAARRAFFLARKKAHLLPTRRVNATGSRRRLQALKAIGWSAPRLAVELGRSSSLIDKVIYKRQQTVTITIEKHIRQLYDRLWETPGGCEEAVEAAARRGWRPPLWWDDDQIDDPSYKPLAIRRAGRYDVDPIAVELVLTGHRLPTQLTRGERLAAADELTRRGVASREIAQRLDVTPRTIVRDRNDLRRSA